MTISHVENVAESVFLTGKNEAEPPNKSMVALKDTIKSFINLGVVAVKRDSLVVGVS